MSIGHITWVSNYGEGDSESHLMKIYNVPDALEPHVPLDPGVYLNG
jgi:hypothetical protein